MASVKESLKGADDLLRSGHYTYCGELYVYYAKLFRKRWKRRYVMISDSNLYIYASRHSKSPEKVYSFKLFDRANTCDMIHHEVVCFCLKYKNDTEPLTFSCDTEETRKRWLGIFHFALPEKGNIPIQPSAYGSNEYLPLFDILEPHGSSGIPHDLPNPEPITTIMAPEKLVKDQHTDHLSFLHDLPNPEPITNIMAPEKRVKDQHTDESPGDLPSPVSIRSSMRMYVEAQHTDDSTDAFSMTARRPRSLTTDMFVKGHYTDDSTDAFQMTALWPHKLTTDKFVKGHYTDVNIDARADELSSSKTQRTHSMMTNEFDKKHCTDGFVWPF